MRVANIMLSNRFGGIGQAYLDYNASLLDEGHEVLAICHREGGWLELTKKQQGSARLSIVSVTEKGGLKGLPSAWKIRRACKTFRPDAIVIHNYLYFNLLATRGIAPQLGVTHMYKCKHFDKLAGVIALTDELRQMCQDAGVNVPIHIVPNMIDGPFIEPKEGWRDANRPVIGGLGRLDAHKGYEHLIEACSLLRSRGRAFRCVIGGTGFDESALHAQVKDLGLEDIVRFVGFVDNKQRFFESIDLFIAPSVQETFGITLLEAMKYGRPVIATATGGHTAIVTENQNGLLVPPRDPAALADSIDSLLADPDRARQYAIAASRSLHDHYTMSVVGAQLTSALRKTLQTPRQID